MTPHAELEAQIDRWRGYVQRRQAISPADVDELEDHLRGQIADRQATGLVVAALALDAVMLTAMLTRIAEFGSSPNKIAALGLNVLLLVHLLRAAWLSVGFLRGQRPFVAVERWQTQYLPVYGAWAAVVVLAFPPVFGFA